jgi:conjugal transfer pilus assembly protein TraI
MIIKWLLKQTIRPSEKEVTTNTAPSSLKRPHSAASAIPVYPPVDTGIQITEKSLILASQHELMARLRILAGGTDEFYEKYFHSVVINLADYIQLLPASQGTTHMGAGGLFRLCLEVGFFSLQSAERIVFAGQDTIELRRELEPRWRYATFLAGLCSELHRVISEMAVTDSEGNAWPKYLKSLTQWSQDGDFDRYYVQWHKSQQLHTMSTGRSDVAVIMLAILPKYTLQYLEDVSTSILPVVFAVASGSSHPTDTVVAKLVFETRNKIFKRDDATRKEKYGQLTVGNHLEPYLLDAMRQLVKTGIWKINEPKARMWFSSEGLFLIWKSAAKEMLSEISVAGVSGAPKDIGTLAEILCDAKIAERNGKDLYWMIIPEGAADAYQSIKIANPLSILEDTDLDEAKIQIQHSNASPTSDKKIEPASVPTAPIVDPIQKTKPKPKAAVIDAQRDLLALEEDSVEPEPQKTAPQSKMAANNVEDSSSEEMANLDIPLQIETGESTRSTAKVEVKRNSENHDRSQKTASTKQASPRKVEVDSDAEILPASKQSNYSSNVSDKARPILKDDICEVIGKMIDDFKKGRNKTSILVVPQGIAFELQQIQKYGLSNDRLIGLLHSNDWLETPDANKNAKFLKVQNLDGKTISAIVIKHSAAEFLGFTSNES